jgi:sec-independent protein translocase protein TatB
VGSLGFQEIAIIAVLALFVLGPDRLPQAAKSVGKAISEFRRLTSGARADLEEALDATGMKDTLAEIRGTVDELNPRRIVTDSLRAVDSTPSGTPASLGTTPETAGFSVTSSAFIPPPDADIAQIENATTVSPVSQVGSSVVAPVIGSGFHDVLIDDINEVNRVVDFPPDNHEGGQR